MKTLRYIFASVIFAISLTSCSTSDWEEMPDSIAEFIARYFPGDGVSHYGESEGVYFVELKGSANLSFDDSYSWMTVNGEGSTLPQIFLFDQLPPALYEYIQEAESLENVYSVSRNSKTYDVTLDDSYLTYIIATKEVHQQYPTD